MIRAVRTDMPIGVHVVTVVDRSGRVKMSAPLFGVVWGEFRWRRTALGGYWEHREPRPPPNPLAPAYVAAAVRRARRAARRAAIAARR